MSWQETYILCVTLVYGCSSVIGFLLFSYMWRLTHGDRKGLEAAIKDESRRERKLKERVAIRNEVVAGVLAVSFGLYSLVGIIGNIRAFHIVNLPWDPGLATVTMLVLGNFMEMLIAVVLLSIRKSLQRQK